MKNITDQITQLNIIWENIRKNIISNGNLISIEEKFKTNKKSIEKVDFNAIGNNFGIYIFYIKPTKVYNIENLISDWTQKGHIKYPKVVKKRFSKHKSININNEYPFYIGKSEKLGSRIKEHITHEKKASTYGLKLKGRDSFNEKNITFSYWELPKELQECSNEIKQFIITQVESKLRDKLNPWIGKQ